MIATFTLMPTTMALPVSIVSVFEPVAMVRLAVDEELVAGAVWAVAALAAAAVALVAAAVALVAAAVALAAALAIGVAVAAKAAADTEAARP